MLIEYICIMAGAAALARCFVKIIEKLEGENGQK